ncbi:MAG: hypothetical protein L3K26_10205 [Candidatus Hydrogenedentes bacterium]|nr:hypothetical protein [Candidatus Hydrogenedentota bacterium]
MAVHTKADEHLSDYERAVCYHTLPRVNHPLTLGLIVAYVVCLVEALGAIAIGYYLERPWWLKVGGISLIALIFFGLIVFTIRAFLNELRRRKALAAAHGVPDARESAHDLPDPFEDHILLHHPSHTRGTHFSLSDNRNTSGYEVKVASSHDSWTIIGLPSQSELRVDTVAHGKSFRFGLNLPSLLKATRDGHEVARIRRHISLNETKVDIEVLHPEPCTIQLRNQGFFVDNRLVGRTYFLRGSFYVDIQRAYFNDGVLAYFVTAI